MLLFQETRGGHRSSLYGHVTAHAGVNVGDGIDAVGGGLVAPERRVALEALVAALQHDAMHPFEVRVAGARAGNRGGEVMAALAIGGLLKASLPVRGF